MNRGLLNPGSIGDHRDLVDAIRGDFNSVRALQLTKLIECARTGGAGRQSSGGYEE
jgi:hypothetical protein